MKFYSTQFGFQILLLTVCAFSGPTLFVGGCHGGVPNRYPCMVRSPAGTYRGLLNASVVNQHFKFCSYRDVPYGRPPTGNLRFGVPVQLKPFPLDTIYNATQDKRFCPQSNHTSTEDCLYLNIFVPYNGEDSHGGSLLPVIVWVHGGGYYFGSKTTSMYSPDYFMLQKVVLVSINYRLGAFGFLNLNIPEAPGNQGIRDQLLALEWLQKNIRSFGGDPKRVTSMGQSAGAGSVGLQLLSPRSRGLINRVIIESGHSPFLTDNSSVALNNSISLAVSLGYKGNTNDRHGILHYLQGLNISRLVDGYTSYRTKTGVNLEPNQDYDGPCPLFPSSEGNLGANAPNIPCMVGINSADGTAYFGGTSSNDVIINQTLSDLNTSLRRFVDPVLVKNNQTSEKVIAKLKAYFYNPRDKNSQLDKTVKLLTSLFFNYHFYDLVRTFRASYVNNNIWTYYFDYSGGYTDYKKSQVGSAYVDEVHGAAHAEELRYLFYAPQFTPNGFRANERELRLIDRMTTWRTNFARTGSPNGNCDGSGVNWYPTTPFQDNYLWIKNDSEPVLMKRQKINQKILDFFSYLREFAQNYNT